MAEHDNSHRATPDDALRRAIADRHLIRYRHAGDTSDRIAEPYRLQGHQPWLLVYELPSAAGRKSPVWRNVAITELTCVEVLSEVFAPRDIPWDLLGAAGISR